MIGIITKSVESFHDDKHRDLSYGTIYYVAGTETTALNEYVLSKVTELENQINRYDGHWLTCKIIYLEADNSLFPSRKDATLYSAILLEDNLFDSEYYFLVALLNHIDPSITLTAFRKYFDSVVDLLEDALDYGEYSSKSLSTIYLRIEDDDIRFSIVSETTPQPSEKPKIEFSIGNLPYGRKPDSRILDELEKKPTYTQPSRLIITPAQHKFLLPDYDNIEIRFTPQVKALYVMFLNHPEGIRMKEIEDYKEEYKKLYFRLTTRSDMDKIRASVEKLIDICCPNIISVKKSQCNNLLRMTLPDIELSRFYEIEAIYGKPHKINLDRSLVSIPDDLRL